LWAVVIVSGAVLFAMPFAVHAAHAGCGFTSDGDPGCVFL
jgi:hypothetical protein